MGGLDRCRLPLLLADDPGTQILAFTSQRLSLENVPAKQQIFYSTTMLDVDGREVVVRNDCIDGYHLHGWQVGPRKSIHVHLGLRCPAWLAWWIRK